jgi:dUTP pyrophosphatase
VKLLNATQTSLEAAAERRQDTEATWEPWPDPVRRPVHAQPDDEDVDADLEPEDDDVPFEATILGAMTNGAGTSQVNGRADVEEDDDEAEDEPSDELGGLPAAARAVPSPHGASVQPLMEIQFQRLSEKATLPARAHEGDAGMDLCAAEAASIGPGQRVQVGTGLAVEIPEGWAGMILPRSGLALKYGIALVNAPGLVDPGYRGEIRVLLLNTDANSEFKVAVGDRIAQMLLTPFSTARPVEVETGTLSETERGTAGFGSSGA